MVTCFDKKVSSSGQTYHKTNVVHQPQHTKTNPNGTIYFDICIVHTPREVHWEVGVGEGSDLTAHAHSAHSYSKHIVLQ
jgi:hypothetical protein